jgi:hypothetical protein
MEHKKLSVCRRRINDPTGGLIGYEFLLKLWLKLSGKFVRELRKYPSSKLWGGGGNQPNWDLKVWQDDYRNMFLIRGWQEFTTHYEVQVGHTLKLRYRGHGRLSVKIFDDTLCHQSYYPPLEDEFGPTTP